MDPSLKTKIFKQLNLVSRHIPKEQTLPRVYYILEPLLSSSGGEVEQDDLSSIFESLERQHGGQEALLYIIWALKETSNEAICNRFLIELLPNKEDHKEWFPENERVLMRLLLHRIDASEHFTNNRDNYNNYVTFILSVYTEVGNFDSFPYEDYTKRLNLYRRMEEKSFITPENISALTDILGRLEMINLKTEIETDFALLLKNSTGNKLVQKYFSQLASKLNQGLVLPRVYYLLERLLTEEAKKNDLLSMYKCLQKRDLNGVDPLWYIIWSLKCTRNEKLAYEYLSPLLAGGSYEPNWYPSNHKPLLLRMIMVEMDMSETFRDSGNYKTFIRSIAGYSDNHIGPPSNYPHDNFEARMNLYKQLEGCKVVSAGNIKTLLTVLEELGFIELVENVSDSYDNLLSEGDIKTNSKIKKVFEAITTQLDCPRILPRIYYLLEYLLKEDAKSNNLYSMYLSLCKRDLKNTDPLWYISWSLNSTFNEQLVHNHLNGVLVRPLPEDWMPHDPMMTLRAVIVRMDLSEEFRNRHTYISFIRCVSPQDEYIGIHEAFPHDRHSDRMNFYRRLENVTLIAPRDITKILDGLRNIGEFGLLDKVDQDFRSMLFAHRKITPTGYYSQCQLAHFDTESPLYSLYKLDPLLPTPATHASRRNVLPDSVAQPIPNPGQTTPDQANPHLIHHSQPPFQPPSHSTTSSHPPPISSSSHPPLSSSSHPPLSSHPLAPTTAPIITDPPSYQSVVSEYQYHPPTTPVTVKSFNSVPPTPSLLTVPSLEERIWIDGESGEDVVDLCISKLLSSYVFPDDKSFMKRVAHVMSNFGKPRFILGTDGGIWQVSLYAYDDNLKTRAHVRLTTKYEKISRCLGIDWTTVERRHLAIPMYSAVAARLYLSNFAEPIPPAYKVEEQAEYWWNIYLKRHEAKHYKKSDFFDTVRILS